MHHALEVRLLDVPEFDNNLLKNAFLVCSSVSFGTFISCVFDCILIDNALRKMQSDQMLLAVAIDGAGGAATLKGTEGAGGGCCCCCCCFCL